MGNHTHQGSQISVVCNPNNPTNQGDSGGKNHPNQPPPPPWVSRTTWDRNQPNNSTSAHSAALNRHEPAHPTPCGCPETPHPPKLPTNQLCRLRNQRPTHQPRRPHHHGLGSNHTARRPKRSNQDAPSPRLRDTPTRHHPTRNQTHAKTIPTHPNTGSNHNHIPPTPHRPEPEPGRRQERGQRLDLGNPTPTSPTPATGTPDPAPTQQPYAGHHRQPTQNRPPQSPKPTQPESSEQEKPEDNQGNQTNQQQPRFNNPYSNGPETWR